MKREKKKLNIGFVVDLARARTCVWMFFGKKTNKKLTNQQKKIESFFVFFSYRITQVSFVFTSIRTERHTQEKRKKREGDWLPSTANKTRREKKRKIKREERDMKINHTVTTTTTATKDEKRKRE